MLVRSASCSLRQSFRPCRSSGLLVHLPSSTPIRARPAVSPRRYVGQSTANLLRYVEDELNAFEGEGVEEECAQVINEFLSQSGYAKRTSEGSIILEKKVAEEDISIVIPQHDDAPGDDLSDDYYLDEESDENEEDPRPENLDDSNDAEDEPSPDEDYVDEGEGDEFFVTISKKDGNALSMQCLAYVDGFDVEAVAIRKKEVSDSFFNARRYLEDHEVEVFKQYLEDKTGLTDGFSEVVASLLDAEHEKETKIWLEGIKEFIQ